MRDVVKKILIQSLIITAYAGLISGCGTVSKEQRVLLDDRSRSFLVAADDATNKPVASHEITNALVQSMYEASQVGRVRKTFNNGTYTQGLSVEIDKSNNITAFYRDNYESLIKYKSGTFKISTIDDGKVTKVNVLCPTTIEDYDSFKGGISGRKLFPDNQVAADLSRICTGLKITIQHQKYVKSEINTQFPSDSTFANYSRKMAISKELNKVNAFDIEKATIFNFNSGKNRIDVAISVFPYRTGSKVVYGFYYPYNLLGDGTSTYRQEDIASLQKTIAAIAND